jgi:hypothetical protein
MDVLALRPSVCHPLPHVAIAAQQAIRDRSSDRSAVVRQRASWDQVRDTEESAMEREYAIGWGTLALINAGLAQGKRRSGLAWFLVSLLLGPVATLLIVVLSPVPRATPEGQS